MQGNRGLKAEAVEYCTEYSYDGVEIGEVFLPSIDELKYLYENRELINEKLALIKRVGLFTNWFYWSSSEESCYTAWGLNFVNGYVGYHLKDYSYFIRPVVAF